MAELFNVGRRLATDRRRRGHRRPARGRRLLPADHGPGRGRWPAGSSGRWRSRDEHGALRRPRARGPAARARSVGRGGACCSRSLVLAPGSAGSTNGHLRRRALGRRSPDCRDAGRACSAGCGPRSRRPRSPAASPCCSASSSPSARLSRPRWVRLADRGGDRVLPRDAGRAAHPVLRPAGLLDLARSCAVVLGLTLYNGVVIAEVLRAGITSLPAGRTRRRWRSG